ncbi:hypothetical protein [Hyphomicrobium methylovorum]|uniref:hypothetical protein n=1 Tax=Hyphomicrobium methylovorum TaxID=84 RepID=UPI001FE30216|nr:hypothetical protein [Hyphomicrobium methylovorum]
MHHCFRVFAAAAALSCLVTGPVRAASLDALAVDVKNESEPVLCAEKDNVALSFTNKEVRSFRLEAAHPAYLSPGLRNNFEPDWTACDMTGDPVFAPPSQPKKVTLYEDPAIWVIGYTFPTFWRPATASVRIGEHVDNSIHMLQLWIRREDGAEEVLVLYPQDGYWRPRPMTPDTMRNTAYGSSFLVGPVDYDGRPLVKIKEVVFEPATRAFTLNFERGGNAVVRLMNADTNKLTLDVTFDKGISDSPFAMLRSMYITEFNNDVARIALRENGAKGWLENNIMAFDKATATDVWAGRLVPSRHNTSSPDLVFNSFSGEAKAKPPKNEAPVHPTGAPAATPAAPAEPTP